MRRHPVHVVALALLAAACAVRPAGDAGGAGELDLSSASGRVTLSGWEASPEEGKALDAALDGFAEEFPEIEARWQPVSGDYPAAMTADFTARRPPTVFYVDSSVAPEWIDQGVLEPLDPYIEASGFDTDPFFDAYLDAFRGPDGKIYGLPKDGNTLAMAYNTDMLERAGVEPPATWDELVAAAEELERAGVTPLCLSHELARVLAFIYQNGGGLLTGDNSAPAIATPESRAAIEWYLGLYARALGARPADLGADWCGTALGQEKVAIAFEGGWLDPFMQQQYPDVSYAWAEMPAGAEQATLAFTVSYSMGVHSDNKEAGWALLSYLTGPEGMELWTAGGIALPSREDVPVPEGKEVFVAGAAYARPWSFVPGFSQIQDAFNNAMTAAIESGATSADDVVSATEQAIEQVLR